MYACLLHSKTKDNACEILNDLSISLSLSLSLSLERIRIASLPPREFARRVTLGGRDNSGGSLPLACSRISADSTALAFVLGQVKGNRNRSRGEERKKKEGRKKPVRRKN